jgi:hypothetical protein
LRSGALETQKIWVKTRLYARARFAGFRKEPLKHVLTASEPSTGALVEKIRNHGFLFEKKADGEWQGLN